jgi:putative peptidoglycan lipid II flippase
VRTVSGVTLLSRLGGLAREVLVARIFGDTWIGSAFAAGFAIPNMFRRLLGEGALSAAFIPEYTQTHKADAAQANRFASLTVLALCLVTTALAVLIELGLLAGLFLLPPSPERTLSFELIMVMLPFMPLVCVAAILGGMLQVHGRFGPAATGPLILNTFIIVVGLYFVATNQLGDQRIAFLLGAATVASGFTQCFWFLKLLRPHITWTRDFAGSGPGIRRMLRRFIPVLIGMGTLQLNTFVDMLIAMWPIWVGGTILGVAYPLDGKSNIIMAAAQRLYQFPLGVFGIAVATAVFPLLSRHADEPDHFRQTLRRGLRLSFFIGLPASVGLVLVRHDLIDVLYGGRSGFSQPSLDRSAAVLAGFSPGVWAYSINHVFTRAFYAKGDTQTPMRVAMAMVLFNFTLNCILMWPLREAGLAWSTSISAIVQCVLLGLLCRRIAGPVIDRDLVTGYARIVAAAGVMAAGVALCAALVPSFPGWVGHLVRVAALCAAGAATYAGAAAVLGCHELRWLLHRHGKAA